MIKLVTEALKNKEVYEIQVGSPLHQDKNIVSFRHKEKYYNFYISGLEELQNNDEMLKHLIASRFEDTVNG